MWNIGYDDPVMHVLALLFIHLVVTITRLFQPGGAHASVAKSLFVKHQLLMLNRSRERPQAPAIGSSHYKAFAQ